MQTSAQGRLFIESFEGLRLAAYDDQRGVATIGYGHTAGVVLGDVCTKEQADTLLGQDLVWAECAVSALIVHPLTQNQFDALVSFTFNLGRGSLEHSTLRGVLNRDEVSQAAEQFLQWNHVAGVVNAGLTRRRAAERLLFLS